MKPVERQVYFEEMKNELTVLTFVKRLLELKSWVRTLFWVAVGAALLFWLVVTLGIIPQAFSWIGLIFLAFTPYGVFKQSELYRRPYYQEHNLQEKPWTTRTRIADLERFRGSLKSKGIYQKKDIDIFTEQTKATLELRCPESIWQYPPFTVALGAVLTLLFQSLSGMGVAVNTTLFIFALFTLFLVLTIVPLIYDISAGERQLLNRLLLFLTIISSDFEA